jgi:hypothetical protein
MIPVLEGEELVKLGNGVFDLVKNGRNVDFKKDSLKNIYGFDSSWEGENLYMVCSRQRTSISDQPLNEIHLLSVSKGAGIKIPNGYSPATEIVFYKGQKEKYLLISRESKPIV